MMQPKKTKFRKAHKGRIHGVATSGAALSFGQFGLKAMAPERITARQIEAARRALTPNCRSRRASSRASRNKDVIMAEMKTADIRAMSPDQMDDAVLNLKKERFNLRFQRATGQLENTSRLREARRDIARIKTIAAQKRAAKK